MTTPDTMGVPADYSRSVGSGQQALSQCQEWSEGPPAVSGVVGRPSRSVGSGQQAVLPCQEWSAGSAGEPADHSRHCGSACRPLPTLPNSYRPLLTLREGLSTTPDTMGVPADYSRSVGSGQQALSQCQEWSEGPPAVSGVVGRPSRSVGSGQQAVLPCQEWSAGSAGEPADHSRHCGSACRPLPTLPNSYRPLLTLREGLSTTPDTMGVPADYSRSVGSGQQALSQCREWSKGPPAVSGVVRRPSRSVGSGR